MKKLIASLVIGGVILVTGVGCPGGTTTKKGDPPSDKKTEDKKTEDKKTTN